jgi:catechol 2,3-dioxygenase-like lactoylglutathione lyase family enzyme
MTQGVQFGAGRNIAMKVPPHLYEATIRFYRDTLGFRQLQAGDASVCFEFGANRLWIDRLAGVSQAELWLELVTSDVEAAARQLAAAGVVRCDDIEPLPEGMQAFWISSPASIVHLVCRQDE